MRSGQRKTVSRKARFILTHVDTGRVSRKTGLPASYLSRVKKRKVKTITPKAEKKLSRMYENYWKNRLQEGGVTAPQALNFIESDVPVNIMENVIDENRMIAETLVENRNRRDMHMPKFNMSWHTVEDVLEQMRANEGYIIWNERLQKYMPREEEKSSWLHYVKRHIAPAVNRGRYYIKPEYRKYHKRKGRRK